MSLSEVLAKRAMEYRMSDEYIKALGTLTLTAVEEAAVTSLMKNIEEENWNAGYDDAMIDTLAPAPVQAKGVKHAVNQES